MLGRFASKRIIWGLAILLLVTLGVVSVTPVGALIGTRRTLLGGNGGTPMPPPCHSYGGYCIGDHGAAGTIYAGHILSWADDFSGPLDIVGPQTPFGKYFTTKGYSAAARGNFTTLAPQFDADPLTTGYYDSNRGVPVGYNNLKQSNGVMTLQARNATAGEQANMNFTSQALNSGVRPQVSSAIHTEGTVGFYPGGTGSVIVETTLKYTGNGQSGWHPTFWTISGDPLNVEAPGNFDEVDVCEGNSFTCRPAVLQHTNGVVTLPVPAGANFTNVYDGNFHTLSVALSTSSTIVFLDGATHNTFAVTSNFSGKPQYALVTSHILNQTWLGENYAQGNWNSTGANIQLDLMRVWRPDNGTAQHWVPLLTIPDLKVDYNGIGSAVLPSTVGLWGDSSVTEYFQAVDFDSNEPGMNFNAVYNQFPPGVAFDPVTRILSVDWSAQNASCATDGCRNSGVLHMVAKAWKPDGSTFTPARFTIYRGPRPVARGANITVGGSSSADIYASCDVGVATTSPPGAKIVSVTNIPSGMSYSSSTGLLTGTPATAGTVTVTCVNNVGQTVTYPYILGPLQNETYALEQRMVNPPAVSIESAIDTAIAGLKTDGLWPNLFSFSFMGLGDQQASLLNWKGDYWNPSLLLTPSFAPYSGFTTDGSSNGVSTNFDASIYSSINALAGSVLSNTSGQTTGGGIGTLLPSGNPGFFMGLRNGSNNFTYDLFDSIFATISNSDGSGVFTGMRSGQTTKKAFRNGSQIGTTLNTATLLSSFISGNFGLGRVGGGGTSSSARQWGAYVLRFNSFADADEVNLNGIIQALKTAAVSPTGMAFGAVNTPNIQVDVGTHTALAFERTQAWTAAAYVTITTPPSGPFPAAVIFTTSNQGKTQTAYTGYEWFIDANCHERIRVISNFNSNNYLGVVGSISFCDGKQHKLAVSYDGSSTVAGVTMYVDGVLDPTGSEGTTLSSSILQTPAQPFIIGNQRGWPYTLGGTLAHFSLSNVVRNQAWVQAYTTAAATTDANTLLAYDFNENTGNTTADASSNAFLASVDNAVWQPSGHVGVAPFIAQGVSKSSAGSSASVSVTLPGIVASGDTVAGAVDCACTTGVTVTDDKSNSYTVIGPNTTLGGVHYWQFYAQNITNAPQTITATLTSSVGTFWGIVTDELVNVKSPIDGSSITYTSAATGANGVTSGAFTTTLNGDFIYGTTSIYDVATIQPGTNFSIQEPAFSGYYFQQTAGSVAATFTPSTTIRAHAGGIAFPIIATVGACGTADLSTGCSQLIAIGGLF